VRRAKRPLANAPLLAGRGIALAEYAPYSIDEACDAIVELEFEAPDLSKFICKRGKGCIGRKQVEWPDVVGKLREAGREARVRVKRVGYTVDEIGRITGFKTGWKARDEW